MKSVPEMPAAPRAAVLYARVSSKDQEREGFSIPAQQKLLRDYARAQGLQVVREFGDVETAKRAGRKSFSEMVTFLRRSPSCRILLVEKTDRLYRNFKDWVTLDELDLELHFVKENVVVSRTSRSSEKFVHGIKVLMAKQYIDNLGEEAAKGMREKAEQGIWPSCAPLGYRNVMGPEGKRLIEPDPVTGPLVTRLFEWYATGRHSLEETTHLASTIGLAAHRTKNAIPRGTMHKLLKSPIYFGEFVWKGRRYRGSHAPLVTRQLFDRVQEVLGCRVQTKARKVKHDFAFSGLVSCGHCGCLLVGELKKARYVYYHCTYFKGRCPEPYVREEVLAERFGAALGRLEFDDEAMAWLRNALRLSHADERKLHEEAIARLHEDYVKIQRRMDAMYVDKLDGRIEADYFDRKASEWRAEQERIRDAIAAHEGANQSYFEDGIRLLEVARTAGNLYRKQDAMGRRRLLDFLLSNSSWKDGQLRAEFRQPFEMVEVAAMACAGREPADRPEFAACFEWRGRRDSNSRPPA